MEKLDQITIHLTPGFAKKLQDMADRLKVSRSTLVRNLLETAYEDARVMELTGILTAVQFGQKILSKIKQGIATGHIHFDKNGDLEIKKTKKK